MANKITIEQLIKRAQDRDNNKLSFKNVYSDILNADVCIKKVPLTQVIDIIDNMKDNSSSSECLEMEKELIYKCCPILQHKELQDAYKCHEPYDIVTCVFDDNMGELNNIAEAIFELYGLSDNNSKQNIVDDIKN